MAQLKYYFIVGALLFGLCANANSNQASTEYVKAAVDALRDEINSRLVSMQTQVNELPILTPRLGEIYQGGIVFWLDASKQHGLVASLHDLTDEHGISWRNGEGGDRMVNAKGRGLYSGETNSRLIVAEQTIDDQQGQFAALLTENYEAGANGKPCTHTMNTKLICYGGWYLPSVYELFLLQSQLTLSAGPYWSSTEASETQAWLLDFESREARMEDKSAFAHVRAVHAF